MLVPLLILTFNLNYSLHFQNFNEKFRRESSTELFISPLLIYLVLFHSKTKKGIEFRIIIFPRRRDREIPNKEGVSRGRHVFRVGRLREGIRQQLEGEDGYVSVSC